MIAIDLLLKHNKKFFVKKESVQGKEQCSAVS